MTKVELKDPEKANSSGLSSSTRSCLYSQNLIHSTNIHRIKQEASFKQGVSAIKDSFTSEENVIRQRTHFSAERRFRTLPVQFFHLIG